MSRSLALLFFTGLVGCTQVVSTTFPRVVDFGSLETLEPKAVLVPVSNRSGTASTEVSIEISSGDFVAGTQARAQQPR